jgi:hypothetical protein
MELIMALDAQDDGEHIIISANPDIEMYIPGGGHDDRS